MDYDIWTIIYILDIIPNYPAGHRLISQAKNNVCIVEIDGDEEINAKGPLEYIQSNQTNKGKSKVSIILL